jgi:hypothetical protein
MINSVHYSVMLHDKIKPMIHSKHSGKLSKGVVLQNNDQPLLLSALLKHSSNYAFCS